MLIELRRGELFHFIAGGTLQAVVFTLELVYLDVLFIESFVELRIAGKQFNFMENDIGMESDDSGGEAQKAVQHKYPEGNRNSVEEGPIAFYNKENKICGREESGEKC